MRSRQAGSRSRSLTGLCPCATRIRPTGEALWRARSACRRRSMCREILRLRSAYHVQVSRWRCCGIFGARVVYGAVLGVRLPWCHHPRQNLACPRCASCTRGLCAAAASCVRRWGSECSGRGCRSIRIVPRAAWRLRRSPSSYLHALGLAERSAPSPCPCRAGRSLRLLRLPLRQSLLSPRPSALRGDTP